MTAPSVLRSAGAEQGWIRSRGRFGEAGKFYLLLSNIGLNAAALSSEVLARAQSSTELTALMRDVDAGDMAFSLDACNSASSIEGSGFKPGPMGSRGLGQLAYNKGMLILAASQADDVALEDPALQQGLLTYALVDGLQKKKADFGSPDAAQLDNQIGLSEWLAYGAARVPELFVELQAQAAAPDSQLRLVHRAARDVLEEDFLIEVEPQQPALFDFRRKPCRVLLWRLDWQVALG